MAEPRDEIDALIAKLQEARRHADSIDFELSTICPSRRETELLVAALRSPGLDRDGERMRGEPDAELEADAARFRYLRDHCSSHFPMTWEQPAEWSIQWEFQQSTPDERFGTIAKWIDEDIRRQDEIDALDDAEEDALPLAHEEKAGC